MLAPTSSELPLFVFVLEALGQKKNGGIEAIWGGNTAEKQRPCGGGQHRREANGEILPSNVKAALARALGYLRSCRRYRSIANRILYRLGSPGHLSMRLFPPSKRPELEPCGNMPSTRHFQDPGSRGGTGCSGPGSRGRNFSCVRCYGSPLNRLHLPPA